MDRLDEKRLATRAWSTLQIKSVDDELRQIEGIASTPATDRMGDIVEPEGAVFKLPLPFLWQHNKGQPLGQVIAAKVTDKGIMIRAQIAKGVAPFIDDAWALIKNGLVRGLSIGFRPLESADINDTFGIRFTKWEWLELSAVTVAANAEASIEVIKSLDEQQMRAALGTSPAVASRVLDKSRPGVSGKPVTLNPRGKTKVKTTAERITEFEGRRTTNATRMAAIMEAAGEDGSTLDASQQEEYDTLADEIKTIDGHIVRLKQLETVMVSRAVPVVAATVDTPAAAADVRGGSIISVRRNLPKGTAFTRYAQALALSKGNLMQAREIAAQWKDTPEVEEVLKSAVTVGTTTDASWAGPLAFYQTMVGEFIDILRPATIIGRIQGLRRIPFNVRIAGKTQASTVGWVGQGSPKPVSALAFNEVILRWAKAAGIVVISQELARFSSPSAEAVIQQDLRDTMQQFLDTQFIDPSVSAVANVSPASITNGASVVQSTGQTVANITSDIESLFSNFIAANLTPSNGVFIMHPTTALGLSMKRTAQDFFAFPDITMMGGTFFGLPVITSTAVPKTASGGSIIVLLEASEIFYADDDQIMLDASQEASLQMNTAPSAGAQSLVSLWQNNLIGIRAERWINWQRRRDTAVTYLDNVPVYA